MPRAIWKGSISFGLVNVPVRMYSAIEEQDLRFHLVHRKDGGRIGYEKICKEEEKPVPADEIVKAYELDNGELVYLEDEDFEAAEIGGPHTIDIQDFVPYEQIDPIYFERTYYLGPDADADKVYSLLVQTMEDTGLAAIAMYVMRDRSNLGCLRVRDGVITLEKMFFADEIRPIDEIKPSSARVGTRELEAAAELVERFTSDFDPKKYKDTYREALLEVIERKRKGEEVHAPRPQRAEEHEDLLAALMASLESSASGRKGKNGHAKGDGGKAGGKRKGADALPDDASREELYALAQEADIPGRSGMSKDELRDALARAAR
jgi:DNA end-binding protein Ku